jgi:hypothetical protein
MAMKQMPARRCRGGRRRRAYGLAQVISLDTPQGSAELLGKRDNDALRPADVG